MSTYIYVHIKNTIDAGFVWDARTHAQTYLLVLETDVAEAALLVRGAQVILQRAEGAALGAVIGLVSV